MLGPAPYTPPKEGDHTDACERRPVECPLCGGRLRCVMDYIGGGSHYWVLRCSDCREQYGYDTYRFALERFA